MSLAVELDGVSFGYDPRRPVLEDVDLEIPEGQFVAIAGPNGGGKTTLLRLIVGLEPAAGAEPSASSASRSAVASRRGLVAYLPQRAQLGIEAPATVREVVSAGRVTRAAPARAAHRRRPRRGRCGDRAGRADGTGRRADRDPVRAASSSGPSSPRRSWPSRGC